MKRKTSIFFLLARDDHNAAVLIDLCHEADLRTPEDVAVIGVGDLESLCAFSSIFSGSSTASVSAGVPFGSVIWSASFCRRAYLLSCF
jgi:hypothetical protein